MVGDYYAVHGRRPDRSEEAVLVRLRPGPPQVVLTVGTGALTRRPPARRRRRAARDR